MKPSLRFLEDALVSRILDEAHDLLATLGVEVHNDAATELLLAHGARKDDRGRVLIPAPVVDRALRAAPHAVRLFDALGAQTHELGGDAVYFTPGSAAIHVLDGETGRIRTPATADYVRYAKLVAGLPHIAAQSTALIPADVPGGDPGQLPALPLAPPRREAGGDRRLQRGGLRGDARPAARGARHAGRRCGRARSASSPAARRRPSSGATRRART